jgi:hypothetical protein
MMNFDQISRTPMESRAERWRVRRGPIYRARGVGGLAQASKSTSCAHTHRLSYRLDCMSGLICKSSSLGHFVRPYKGV